MMMNSIKKQLLAALILGAGAQLQAASDQAAAAQPQPKQVNIGTSAGLSWSRPPRVRIMPGDLEGKPRNVIAAIEADTAGQITNVRIQQSSGLPDLDEMVIRAIKLARFRPYTENGVRYPVKVSQPFLFEANDYSSTQKSRKPQPYVCRYIFKSENIKKQLAHQPVPFQYQQLPKLALAMPLLEGADREVRFAFKVARNAQISGIRISQSSGIAEIDQMVIGALQDARIDAPRHFLQWGKLSFEDRIIFKLSDCPQ